MSLFSCISQRRYRVHVTVLPDSTGKFCEIVATFVDGELEDEEEEEEEEAKLFERRLEQDFEERERGLLVS